MTDKHPYSPLQQLTLLVNQLRKSFPPTVTRETLKKLSIAPNNEGKPISVLKFLGFLDQEGNKTDIAARTFSLHDDKIFSEEFGKQVALSYSELFELHKEDAWNLSQDSLISFFRYTDGSNHLVGKQQAQTFLTLAALSGHGGNFRSQDNNSKGKTS